MFVLVEYEWRWDELKLCYLIVIFIAVFKMIVYSLYKTKCVLWYIS